MYTSNTRAASSTTPTIREEEPTSLPLMVVVRKTKKAEMATSKTTFTTAFFMTKRGASFGTIRVKDRFMG
jgi:hypothetical protein